MIEIKDLHIGLKKKALKNDLVKHLHFNIAPNTVLGIVGESGSGKSLTALALSGLLNQNTFDIKGQLNFFDKQIDLNDLDAFKNLRGKDIGVVFQEPMSSLNPSMTCGKQVAEMLEINSTLSNKDIKKEVITLFKKVQLPRVEKIYHQYPHQLSGGQKQRVMIAMAIACKPKLLIADEPTTALDVSVQKEFIQLLKDLQEKEKMALIFISHDLKLVEKIADQILVMYKGDAVEFGPAKEIFTNAKSRYTQSLLAVKPDSNKRLKQLPTVTSYMDSSFHPIVVDAEERKTNHQNLYQKEPVLVVKNLSKYYSNPSNWLRKVSHTVGIENISFDLFPGETLGIVGPSGCGKSTLSRCIMGLEKASKGKIYFQGAEMDNKLERAKKIQMVFQDPYASLNPLLTIGKAIQEPLDYHKNHENNKERKEIVCKLLEKVGLSTADYDKFPHEFSGGQRQRIVLARALVLNPSILICDESVAALDVSVQAQILNLINDLKNSLGFSCIFIAHDLEVVKYMSDRVLVMYQGKVVEIDEADHLFAAPQHEATKQLIKDIL